MKLSVLSVLLHFDSLNAHLGPNRAGSLGKALYPLLLGKLVTAPMVHKQLGPLAAASVGIPFRPAEGASHTAIVVLLSSPARKAQADEAVFDIPACRPCSPGGFPFSREPDWGTVLAAVQ